METQGGRFHEEKQTGGWIGQGSTEGGTAQVCILLPPLPSDMILAKVAIS